MRVQGLVAVGVLDHDVVAGPAGGLAAATGVHHDTGGGGVDRGADGGGEVEPGVVAGPGADVAEARSDAVRLASAWWAYPAPSCFSSAFFLAAFSALPSSSRACRRASRSRRDSFAEQGGPRPRRPRSSTSTGSARLLGGLGQCGGIQRVGLLALDSAARKFERLIVVASRWNAEGCFTPGVTLVTTGAVPVGGVSVLGGAGRQRGGRDTESQHRDGEGGQTRVDDPTTPAYGLGQSVAPGGRRGARGRAGTAFGARLELLDRRQVRSLQRGRNPWSRRIGFSQ